MDLSSISAEDLDRLLRERIRLYAGLRAEQRAEVSNLARQLASRRMPFPFILASVRSQARDLAAEAEVEANPPDAELRRFIAENALPPEQRVTSQSQPRRETRQRERELLTASVLQLVREARASHHPHERRKMRRMLMAIDLPHLRRTLGTEGHELAHEVQSLLRQLSDVR